MAQSLYLRLSIYRVQEVTLARENTNKYGFLSLIRNFAANFT